MRTESPERDPLLHLRSMMWLGSTRGYLTDWITQLWVRATGRQVDLHDEEWLHGPIAPVTGIRPDYFDGIAERAGLVLSSPCGDAGIIPNIEILDGPDSVIAKLDPAVRKFYEETSTYELDAWAEWCGLFRPFGWLVAVLFSRRLQQLNVPLSSLDTSRGLTSEILQLNDPMTGAVRHTIWFRRLLYTGNVLYAGFYSTCRVPLRRDVCVKVVFPLPNGNATVVMYTEVAADGSLTLTSAGNSFGDAGFYFIVHSRTGAVWARYVRALRETIRVYPAETGTIRADHVLKYCGATFLRLHYRMRRSPSV